MDWFAGLMRRRAADRADGVVDRFGEQANFAANVATIAGTVIGGAFFAVRGQRTAAGQAARLALRTRLWPSTLLQRSHRPEVATLAKALGLLEEEKYVLVEGAKGVGKTTLVRTATHRKCAAVVEVAPGKSHDEILAAVHREIVSSKSVNDFNSPTYIRKLVRWHARFTGERPLVHIMLAERVRGPYAQIAGAARALANTGLRVIVDASPGSLAPEADATLREEKFFIHPFTREAAEKEFAPLYARLMEAKLDGVVWSVIGGNAAHHINLQKNVQVRGKDCGDVADRACAGRKRRPRCCREVPPDGGL
jgi:hypothetical protein